MLSRQELLTKARDRRQLTDEVKRLIAERLGFMNDPRFDPAVITDDQALVGRGLELDSIDTVEISLAIREKFDVYLTDDDPSIFGSVNRLVDYIVEHKA
jgi:acyl carrier protein